MFEFKIVVIAAFVVGIGAAILNASIGDKP